MSVWVRDLLGLWVSRDSVAAEQNMGYPTCSAAFVLSCEDVDETEDTAGYSSSELASMTDGAMWMAQEHPDHWRALSREFRTWTRSRLVGKPGDAQLVEEGLLMLGEYIDRSLG